MRLTRVENIMGAAAIMRHLRVEPVVEHALKSQALMLLAALADEPDDPIMQAETAETLVSVKRELRLLMADRDNWKIRNALGGVLLLLMP